MPFFAAVVLGWTAGASRAAAAGMASSARRARLRSSWAARAFSYGVRSSSPTSSSRVMETGTDVTAAVEERAKCGRRRGRDMVLVCVRERG